MTHPRGSSEYVADMIANGSDALMLLNEDGSSQYGLCGHCGINVDNFDANHRVTPIMRGGRGVECCLRGDIQPWEAGPLRWDAGKR